MKRIFLVIVGIFTAILLSTNQPEQSTFLQQEPTPVVKYLKPTSIASNSSGLAPIDCIYVINLEKRKEKWERTLQRCEERGLHPNRFDAVLGTSLSQESIQELMGSYDSNRLSPGEAGCLLSHISVMKDAYDRGFNMIWIMEDDVLFAQDIHQIPGLLAKLSTFDPDWDLFYTDPDMEWEGHRVSSRKLDPRLDQRLKHYSHYTCRTPINAEISRCGIRFGAHSMILSRNGIEKILNYFTHVYLWTRIDADIHYIPDLREYCSESYIVTQETGFNSIHDTFRSKLDMFNVIRMCRGLPRTIRMIWDQAIE